MTHHYVGRQESRAMAEANWKRLKQSEVMDYGGELPARVVIEHDEEDHSYRTFLESVTPDGKPGSAKGVRFFYWEKEALEDYMNRLGAARKGVRHRERA
jgi:hypothetical protein